MPFYEEIQIDDQKRVAVISFTQGVAKPYVLRHNNREDIYIRIGSTSLAMFIECVRDKAEP